MKSLQSLQMKSVFIKNLQQTLHNPTGLNISCSFMHVGIGRSYW